jgi:hypothetical protein
MRVVLVVFLALAGLALVLLYLRSGHSDGSSPGQSGR